MAGAEKPPTREVIFEGRTGTGKTRPVCEFLVEVCQKYPRTKILLFRKTRVSMNDSVLDTLENEVLGPDHPMVIGKSRDHRTKYEFANGSEIVLGGYNNPRSMFSTQYHICWCNEVQELEEDEWEYMHRAMRRPGGPPFKILGGDCNPEDYGHWANQRCMPDDIGRTRATRLVGQFHDNPRWYSHERQEWTEEGVEFLLGISDGLTGVRRDRLFLGQWVSAEGMVWETFDRKRHLIDARLTGDPDNGFSLWKRVGIDAKANPIEEEIRLKWFMASHDFGTSMQNPGALQVWGFDGESRMYLVAEHYHIGWDYDQWSEKAVELYKEFRYTIGVCDHAPAAIPVFNKRCSMVAGRDMPGLWREWSKKRGADGEKTGIDQVRVAFRKDQLFLVRDVLRDLDHDLRRKRKPVCFADEITQYVYPVTASGKRNKDEPDPRCADHGADACRGAVAWAFLKDLSPAPPAAKIPGQPGTVNHEFLKNRAERAKRSQRRDTSRW